MIDRLGNTLQHLKDVIQRLTAAQWFLVIMLIFGLIFVVKTPPLWGNDETSHFARAYQVAQVNFVSDRMDFPYGGQSYGGKIPKTVHDLIWHTNNDIESDRNVTPHGTHLIDDANTYQEFTNQKLDSNQTRDYFFPNTAAYSPIAYVPSVVGIKIAQILDLNIGQSIFLARIGGLLFYTACVFWVLSALRRMRYVWVVFAVSLIPTSVFQASTVSADGMANGLAILLTAFVVKSLVKKSLSRSEIIAASGAALALPLIKPTYIVLSLLIFLIPNLVIRNNLKINPVYTKIALVGFAFIGFVAWTYLTSGVSEEIRRMGLGPRWMLINPAEQTEFLLKHPWALLTAFSRSFLMNDGSYIGGLFGQFGFSFVQVPMTSIIASFISILLALGISEKLQINRTNIMKITLILGLGIASIFGTLYITFSNVAQPIIEGVQGRYFIPYVLLALTVVAALNSKLKLNVENNHVFLTRAIILLCLTSLLFAATKFIYVMYG